jgi:signal transduction histidine kinase
MKFTSCKGKIILGAIKKDTNAFEIFVQDTGIGISSTQLAKIFIPFNK